MVILDFSRFSIIVSGVLSLLLVLLLLFFCCFSLNFSRFFRISSISSNDNFSFSLLVLLWLDDDDFSFSELLLLFSLSSFSSFSPLDFTKFSLFLFSVSSPSSFSSSLSSSFSGLGSDFRFPSRNCSSILAISSASYVTPPSFLVRSLRFHILTLSS